MIKNPPCPVAPFGRLKFRSLLTVVTCALLGLGILTLQAPFQSASAQKPSADAKKDQKSSRDGEVRKGGDKAKEGKSSKRRDGKRRRKRGPTKVGLDAVTRGISVETTQIYGRMIAMQSGVVAARTRGAVATIQARVGDRVKKGDLLVTLLSDMLDAARSLKAAELNQFTAAIVRADAQLRLAVQELKRLERLRRSAAFSVARHQDKLREVERYRGAKAEALAKKEQARAELRMADINLRNAQITAPFDGVVTRRHVEVGNFLNVGSPVMAIVNDTALEVEAEVPVQRLGGLPPGTIITVIPEHGKPFKARVRAIVPEENAMARTRLIRFTPELENRNGSSVAANQSVLLRIPTAAPRMAITVHKDAITQRRGRRVVFLYNAEDKKVVMRQVDLGDAFGGRFEVVKGLKAGDQVVVLGNERLRPGQKVLVAGGGEKKGVRGKRGGDGSKRRSRDQRRGSEGSERKGGPASGRSNG
jgi:RND family efflux transporter MFP subunit